MSQTRPPNRPDNGATAIGGERRRRPWWLLLLLLLAAIVVLILLLSRCGGDDNDSNNGSGDNSSPTAAATAPSESTTTTSAATQTSPATPQDTSSPATTLPPPPPVSPSVEPSISTATNLPQPTATGGGVNGSPLVAGGVDLLPLSTSAPKGALAKYDGKRARAAGVQVLSVPADEGFWVGTSSTDRVWVQLVGNGESPYQVKTGDHIDFTGTVVRNGPGFAQKVGVDQAEGADQLTAERSHIQVATGKVSLTA